MLNITGGMMNKIAVAIIHGIGEQDDTFAFDIANGVRRFFIDEIAPFTDKPKDALEIEPVWWARALSDAENEFHDRIIGERYDDRDTFLSLLPEADHPNFERLYEDYMDELRRLRLDFMRLRAFIVRSGADVIAYQPIPGNRVSYDRIHNYVSEHITALAERAGANAPLCVIAHSLGTVVASNYLWDLQHIERNRNITLVAAQAEQRVDSALEKGETLAHFYTLGSPLALWGLRWSESEVPFGMPITFPAPTLKDHHPRLSGEWINFYDRDDIIAYPLRPLNGVYRQMVTEDREVNVGKIGANLTPISHMGYWKSEKVQRPIAQALAKTWKIINGKL